MSRCFLPQGEVKCSGQMTTFVDQETTWAQHRIRCAWSAFAKRRQALTSQSYLQRHRLHLFDAVVTPAISYSQGMGYNKRTRKNAPLHTSLNASTHHPDKRKMQKQKETGGKIRDDEISEETQEEDNTHDEYDQDSSIGQVAF